MFLSRLRLLTAGESHGPCLSAILAGMPAGLPLDTAALDRDLARRQRGFGSGARMRIEQDHARLTGGVMAGRTTGAPIGFTIDNRDHRNWAGKDVPAMTVPRPGHADLTAAIKYGYGDLRLGLERASARETAARTAAGAIARALLAEFGIVVGGCTVAIGAVRREPEPTPVDADVFAQRFAAAEQNDLRCADEALAAAMQQEIEATIAAKDTVGGVIEVAALHVPPGLGSHVLGDQKLDARLAGALLSLPAAKAVEFGCGFAVTGRRGTAAQDPVFVDGDALVRRSNHAGGIEGGISNGAPIVARVAIKPIATTLVPQPSVDLATGQATVTRYERSDFCQVPRAVPIAEAMVALVLADALLEKLGGDSMDELRTRFAALRGARRSDLPMDGRAWRFGYEG